MLMSLTLYHPSVGSKQACEVPLESPRTLARVHIGQVIMSICTKLQNKEHVIEALRRAKFKFPGHQKIHISKKWGFTKFNANESEDMAAATAHPRWLWG
ncbi:60S ribosomal protein L10-like [Saguinus oedipus]|uniref:60S ribosomal protein L10-like n=1 Tax=Saguinus oedipus TaxID=9490 RepID=A0ABQ9TU71_SAGOE|nr:60S ribosomal protein L10-like [Saguinus oedipus]